MVKTLQVKPYRFGSLCRNNQANFQAASFTQRQKNRKKNSMNIILSLFQVNYVAAASVLKCPTYVLISNSNVYICASSLIAWHRIIYSLVWVWKIHLELTYKKIHQVSLYISLQYRVTQTIIKKPDKWRRSAWIANQRILILRLI